MRFLSTCGMLVCIVWLPACGGKDPNDPGPLVPVSGHATIDGAPLPTGVVHFYPDQAKGNTGREVAKGEIDNQGEYSLSTVGKEGAPLGWYKVAVIAEEPGEIPTPGSPPKMLIEMKYLSPQTTDLSVEIVEQPAPGAYDLKLKKWKPSPGPPGGRP